MGALATEFFENSPLLVLPLISLFIFATIFMVMTVRAIRMDKELLEEMSTLPLEEDHHG